MQLFLFLISKYCAELCKVLKYNKKACEYINDWAILFNTEENNNPINKQEFANNFYTEIGIIKIKASIKPTD